MLYIFSNKCSIVEQKRYIYTRTHTYIKFFIILNFFLDSWRHCIFFHPLSLTISFSSSVFNSFTFFPFRSLSFSLYAWSPQPGEAPPESNYNLKQRSEPCGAHHQSSHREQPGLMCWRGATLTGQKAVGSKHTHIYKKHQSQPLSHSMTNNNRSFGCTMVTLPTWDQWETKQIDREREQNRQRDDWISLLHVQAWREGGTRNALKSVLQTTVWLKGRIYTHQPPKE